MSNEIIGSYIQKAETMPIKPNEIYYFTKSGNRVRAIEISEPYRGQECWSVERVDGTSKGKGMIVPARALVMSLES